MRVLTRITKRSNRHKRPGTWPTTTSTISLCFSLCCQGVCGEFGWVGFLVVCFLDKPIPTHEKIFAVGKSGPIATFDLFFSWVGLSLGWGVRRFHDNIHMFAKPTEFGISHEHPNVLTNGDDGRTWVLGPEFESHHPPYQLFFFQN